MSQDKVSVIIPVFNREKTIEKCIYSVCNQSYKNLEIIIIDDGSKDLTLSICYKLKQKDARIAIIEKQWGGVSSARNAGLDAATGKYLQFVDADDSIAQGSTACFLKNIKQKKSDLVICGYEKVFSKFILHHNQLDHYGTYSAKAYLIQTLKDPGHHYYGAIWNKFYRRDIVEKYHIRFDRHLDLGEDFVFNLQYLTHVSTVFVIKQNLYLYNCNNTNTLSRYKKDLETSVKELNNRHLIFDEYKNAFTKMDLFDTYKNKILRYWLNYLAVNIYYIRHESSDLDEKSQLQWRKILREDKDVSNSKYTVSPIRFQLLLQKIYWRNTIKKLLFKIIVVH